MAVGDLPTMASTAYASTTSNVGDLWTSGALVNQYPGHQRMGVQMTPEWQKNEELAQFIVRGQKAQAAVNNVLKETDMASRRMVQVFIADVNDNIPLDKCLLYTGEPKLTDLTDQELFFEIDIKGALEKHNAERVKMVDKKVKERTEYLEPARIRDLKMTVVTIASF